jgi:hypothetical protein
MSPVISAKAEIASKQAMLTMTTSLTADFCIEILPFLSKYFLGGAKYAMVAAVSG